MKIIGSGEKQILLVCLAKPGGAGKKTTQQASLASHSLFERGSTCLDPGYTQCLQPGLPPSFCCPPSSVCIPLASNTIVLCCPDGESCATILAIACDISEQNNTLHPNSTVTTTALNVPLPNCGEGCCLFGYTCNSITAIRM